MRTIFNIALLFSFLTSSGQSFDNYQILKCSGNIPEDFRRLSVDKYKEDISKIEDKGKLYDTKADFYLESNYQIDQLLLSGKVLFNDPVTRYVNEVAQEIIIKNPELSKKDMRFYTVKSTAVNAFAVNSGVIFINLGLLARLENEAQLAFILSHEISHYQKNHVIDSYVEYERIKEGKGVYRKASWDKKLLARSNFSKKNETEADLEGVKLYLNTNYDPAEISRTLEILGFAHVPFGDNKFDLKLFEDEFFKVHADYYLKETAAIESTGDYNDSTATHPNIDNRIKAITGLIGSRTNTGNKRFVVSQDDFNKIKDISRFETCRQYLLDRDYVNALYASFLLQSTYKNNKYLETTMGKALYCLSKFKNNFDLYKILPKHEYIQGNSQQLYYLFSEIRPKELNTISLKYQWKLKQKYPNNAFIDKIYQETLHDIVFIHELDQDYFYTKPPKNIDADVKKQKMNNNRLALIKELKDPVFVKDFEAHLAQHLEYLKKEEIIMTEEERKAKRKERLAQQKLERKKGKALGIQNVAVVSPFYVKISLMGGKKHIKSEISQQKLCSLFDANITELNMKSIILDPKSYRAGDVERFNHTALLNDWYDERTSFSKIEMISMTDDELDKTVEYFGTKHFLWSGVINITQPRTDPLFQVAKLVPEKQTLFYSALFDVSTGELLLLENKFKKIIDTDSYINSKVKYTLFQIQNKR